MSLILNGSSEIRRFEHSDKLEIRDGIMFVSYPGLAHVIFRHQVYMLTSEVFLFHGDLTRGQLLYLFSRRVAVGTPQSPVVPATATALVSLSPGACPSPSPFPLASRRTPRGVDSTVPALVVSHTY